MRPSGRLRLLCLFGFLLLMAPFYDACDGEYFLKKVPEKEVVIKPFQEKVYDIVVDEKSFNGFEIAQMSLGAFKNGTFQEFKEMAMEIFSKKSWYSDLGFFISLLFDFIVIFSFSMVVLSFTKKSKILSKLVLVNSILVVITLLYIIFLEESFIHFRQIKWGYYAFTLVQIAIFIYSRKYLRLEKNR